MTTAIDHSNRFNPSDFARFVLRWLAVLCLAYGVLGIANRVTALVALHAAHYQLPDGSERASILNSVMGVVVAIEYALAAAGGAGLLARKRWGRTLLLTWAIASMATSLATTIFSVVGGVAAISSGLPATRDGSPFSVIIWAMLINLLSGSVFPLLVAGILWQAGVRREHEEQED